MGKNYNKYYLRIDGTIIDFEGLLGFYEMENFLKLSIFTGLFKNQEELIEGLIRMGLLQAGRIYGLVEIVKRTGNKVDGYDYVTVSDEIVYIRAASFLSIACINEFFYKNKDNYDAIVEILESFHSEIARLVSVFEVKINHLQWKASRSTGEELEDLYLAIENRKSSLRNFTNELLNIEAILELISMIRSTTIGFSRQAELEYIDRLDIFVINEVNYVRGYKKSPNERGLVRLALAIARVSYKYTNLKYPSIVWTNNGTRLELLVALREAVRNPKTATEQIATADDEYGEPDDFMFLEEEDFVLPEDPTDEEIESHEDSIEGLRFKKKRYQ